MLLDAKTRNVAAVNQIVLTKPAANGLLQQVSHIDVGPLRVQPVQTLAGIPITVGIVTLVMVEIASFQVQ